VTYPPQQPVTGDKDAGPQVAICYDGTTNALTTVQKISEFARDSLLEGDGFELPVPREMTTIFEPSCFWFL
jgi:hypothetical protein